MRREFALYSNEWSVPYGLLGLFALLMGGLSYLVHLYLPTYSGVFTNVMFVVLLLLLSLFYKKLYITRVNLSFSGNTVFVHYHKLLFPVKKEITSTQIRYLGLGKTDAVTGLFQVPEKHWILIEVKGKKYFFYGIGQAKELKGLYHDLLGLNPDIVVRENIFR